MLETGILHGMHLLAIRGDQGIAMGRGTAEVRCRTRSWLMKSQRLANDLNVFHVRGINIPRIVTKAVLEKVSWA